MFHDYIFTENNMNAPSVVLCGDYQIIEYLDRNQPNLQYSHLPLQSALSYHKEICVFVHAVVKSFA